MIVGRKDVSVKHTGLLLTNPPHTLQKRKKKARDWNIFCQLYLKCTPSDKYVRYAFAPGPVHCNRCHDGLNQPPFSAWRYAFFAAWSGEENLVSLVPGSRVDCGNKFSPGPLSRSFYRTQLRVEHNCWRQRSWRKRRIVPATKRHNCAVRASPLRPIFIKTLQVSMMWEEKVARMTLLSQLSEGEICVTKKEWSNFYRLLQASEKMALAYGRGGRCGVFLWGNLNQLHNLILRILSRCLHFSIRPLSFIIILAE